MESRFRFDGWLSTSTLLVLRAKHSRTRFGMNSSTLSSLSLNSAVLLAGSGVSVHTTHWAAQISPLCDFVSV